MQSKGLSLCKEVLLLCVHIQFNMGWVGTERVYSLGDNSR